MTELATSSHPLPAWADFLDRIGEVVRQSLELAVEPAAATQQGPGAGAIALQSLDDRLTRWQACLDQATIDTEEAATLAAKEESALAALTREIQESREKLANWLKRAV